MNYSYKICVLGGSLVLALSMSACSTVSEASPQNTAANTAGATFSANEIKVSQSARDLLPERVRTSGVLRIASDPTSAPFGYFDTDNTTLIGWDIDISAAVAATLGLKDEHIAENFDAILPGLASGKYDMAAANFAITPEREKIVDMVEYLGGGSAVAVLPENPQNISMDALSMCGKKIAVLKGSIQAIDVLPTFSISCAEAGKSSIDIRTFPGQNDVNLALISGRVDAVVSDSVSLSYQSKLANNKFELAKGEDFEPGPGGLALGKASGLKAAVTEALRAILDSGYYHAISAKWGIPESAMVTSDVLAKK